MTTLQAQRNDSPLLHPTLEKLDRFDFDLSEQITAHLDADYDPIKPRTLLTELGCGWVINRKGKPVQFSAQWVVERTNC